MPAASKPVKSERTHEENQERAYIAASRRSDRSLEARIESARRASEIHKKRTGRGLRVTEQDVVNEEMYEEEDEDLPTQYQRLSAHLHTGSLQFNRKLHDYIATQHGVRNLFLQQYQPLPAHGSQLTPNVGSYSQMQSPFISQQMMLPPQTFNQAPQAFNQSAHPSSPQGHQQPQQGYRHTPYPIPSHRQHQRSASIPSPQQMPGFTGQYFAPVGTPQTEEQRRLSLPPQALEQSSYSMANDRTRPSLSRSTTSQSIQQIPVASRNGLHRKSATPPSTHESPPSQLDNSPPSSFPFMTMNCDPSSQVLDMNPLSMSLPPESQQFLGSVLDPDDPYTSIFMAGSDQIPQPFGKYTYHPNIGDKLSRAANSAPFSPIKVENTPSSNTLSAMSGRYNITGHESQNLFSDGADFTQANSFQNDQAELEMTAFEDAFTNADVWGTET